jgi:hypothetical protein
MDRGSTEELITLVFPETTRFNSVEIPKEKNPNLITLHFANLKFAYYFKDRKGFVFDCDGIYCGTFERCDLKRLFWRIGTILRTVKG